MQKNRGRSQVPQLPVPSIRGFYRDNKRLTVSLMYILTVYTVPLGIYVYERLFVYGGRKKKAKWIRVGAVPNIVISAGGDEARAGGICRRRRGERMGEKKEKKKEKRLAASARYRDVYIHAC